MPAVGTPTGLCDELAHAPLAIVSNSVGAVLEAAEGDISAAQDGLRPNFVNRRAVGLERVLIEDDQVGVLPCLD